MVLVLKIDKGKIRSHIKRQLLLNHPELQKQFTKRLSLNAFVFIQGYLKCLTQMGETPMEAKEVEILVLQEAYEFVYNTITKENEATRGS